MPSSEDTPTRTAVAGPGQGAPALDEARFAPGAVLAGRYRIVALLGRGGMGEVYRADDLKLRQPVALKFLPADLAADPSRLARLIEEVRMSRQVSHPNVCRVHDIGEAGGQHFLCMEFVDGEDLASLLRRIGRLPEDKAVEIGRQLCAGLAAVHERGLLHRDLKPANVMVDGRGRARLADLGLAVASTEARAGEVAGTPAYMAPEQGAGAELSVRSDVYALGLVLYEMLTGRRPFGGATVSDVVRQHREAAPLPPSSQVLGLDPALERLVLRCLEKDPQRRPASALAVAAGLPGGDPLAAMLAAGETPPPEMVAAAGERGALRPAHAWALLASLAALLPLALWMGAPQVILSRVPLPKTPEVLADRAREVLARLGLAEDGTDLAFGFTYDTGYLSHLVEKDSSARRWDPLARSRPAALRFWYRTGREPLQPRGWTAGPTPEDPPVVRPGMVSLRLDTEGRLVELQALPPPEAPAGPSPAPDWAPLLEAAGVEPGRFAPVAPEVTPPVHADARAAWEGTWPEDPALTVRVEAGAFRGRPVFFRALGPWDRGGRPPARRSLAQPAILLVGVGAGLLFGWRNLRAGRADREGALRLATLTGLGTLAAWLLDAGFGTSMASVWSLVFRGLCLSSGSALLVWLFYVTIEPFVRRRWPESLISWTRLLHGGWRDPRVGRDVLVGLVFTWALTPLVVGTRLAPTLWGAPPPRLSLVDLDPAISLRHMAAWLAVGFDRAAFSFLLFLVVLLLLRVVLRRLWVAVAAFAAVFGVAIAAWLGAAHWTEAIGYGLMSALFVGLLARFGLLAMAVPGFFVDPVFPLSSAVGSWQGRPTLILVAGVAAAGVAAFRVSLGGQPALGGRLLDDGD